MTGLLETVLVEKGDKLEEHIIRVNLRSNKLKRSENFETTSLNSCGKIGWQLSKEKFTAREQPWNINL